MKTLVVVTALLGPAAAHADVVELVTGERLQGARVRASPDHVTIQVGGKTLILDKDRVRAIYFGAAPPPCTQPQQPTPSPPQ